MKRISVRVDEDTLDNIDERAEIEGSNRSEVVRSILNTHAEHPLSERVEDLEERVEALEEQQGIVETIRSRLPAYGRY